MKTKVGRFNELIAWAPTQAKAVIYAITLLTERNASDEFQTEEVYNQYRTIARDFDVDVFSVLNAGGPPRARLL